MSTTQASDYWLRRHLSIYPRWETRAARNKLQFSRRPTRLNRAEDRQQGRPHGRTPGDRFPAALRGTPGHSPRLGRQPRLWTDTARYFRRDGWYRNRRGMAPRRGEE